MLSDTDRTIKLRQGQWSDLGRTAFFHASNGKPGGARTEVNLKAADGLLVVRFKCLDNPHWKFNTYKTHNTDLWRQEVFEIFIAAGSEEPTRYLELEINPHNAFFAAWVENISGQRPDNLTMLSHDVHQIQHETVCGSDDEWSGSISIPLSLLQEGDGEPTYRLNFYRIVLRSAPSSEDWECSPANCDFLCWSPTMSGEEPAFHRPKHFGTLRILT